MNTTAFPQYHNFKADSHGKQSNGIIWTLSVTKSTPHLLRVYLE